MSGTSPASWDGEGDEPTTILQGSSLQSAPAEAFGAPLEDEPTQILQAPQRASTSAPESALRTAPEENAFGAPPEDEPTQILQAQAALRPDPSADGEDDEPTTILQAPAGPAEPMSVADADPDEATSILVASEEIPPAEEATEIMHAVGPAGLAGGARPGGSSPGRTWFDGRLADFTGALLYDQAGTRRPPDDRRALGAAARDMIERVALRDAAADRALAAAASDGGAAPAGSAPEAGALKGGTLHPGQLLVNTYFVRALIARGGVGEIYRARHRDLKTEHAIKILLPHYALDATLLSLMLEEARLLALVRHDAVVACQGLLRDIDGRPLLVMAYLRGPTLSARLRDGPLDAHELVSLADRLASGLAAIHDQGVVHQDISPDNIILADNSVAAATIIDFGLARSLADGGGAHRSIDFAGKFSWCSPEQLTGKPGGVDTRSDLYSLGLVLAAAGLGYRLEMGNDPASARAARQTVPLLPGIAEPVAGVVRRLLAPAASGRPESAGEVLALLKPRPRGGIMRRFFGA